LPLPDFVGVSGLGLSVGDVQRWSAASVRDIFHVGQSAATTISNVSRGLGQLTTFDSWGGDAAEAAKSALAVTRQDLDSHGAELLAVALAARTAADDIENIQAELRALISKAENLGLELDPVNSSVEVTPNAVGGPAIGLINAIDLQQELDAILVEADEVDDALANAINMVDGDDFIPQIPGSPTDVEARLQSQRDAFEQVYGRPPSSQEDWAKASWLDPENFDPALNGVDSSVVVTRIKPVPGQGVVRGSLFIMDDKVVDPFAPNGYDPASFGSLYDYGNNRGFSENFDPRNAKGAFLIDYENGVAIFRQNPTHDTAGQVKVGTPDVRVTQAADGTVRMDYNLPNPAAMLGPVNAAELSGKPVAGTLLVSPGAAGPTASGFIGDYPSAEISADRLGGGTRVLLADEQDNRTSFGPNLELGSYHFVGDLPSEQVQRELGFSPTHLTFHGPGGSMQVVEPLDTPTVSARGITMGPP
jgi:hypothetical protein